jgi:hypothetical protein
MFLHPTLSLSLSLSLSLALPSAPSFSPSLLELCSANFPLAPSYNPTPFASAADIFTSMQSGGHTRKCIRRLIGKPADGFQKIIRPTHLVSSLSAALARLNYSSRLSICHNCAPRLLSANRPSNPHMQVHSSSWRTIFCPLIRKLI